VNKENRKKLQALHLAYNHKKYPSVPIASIGIYECNDRTANGLTKIIIHFLKWRNHHAERINVVSRQIKGKYIKSTMQKGTADISATIFGRSVKIEVKIGKDRQSDLQRQYEHQIIDAGGYYYIATDFDSFIIWYNTTFF
jgi:hypothetical protein